MERISSKGRPGTILFRLSIKLIYSQNIVSALRREDRHGVGGCFISHGPLISDYIASPPRKFHLPAFGYNLTYRDFAFFLWSGPLSRGLGRADLFKPSRSFPLRPSHSLCMIATADGILRATGFLCHLFLIYIQLYMTCGICGVGMQVCEGT